MSFCTFYILFLVLFSFPRFILLPSLFFLFQRYSCFASCLHSPDSPASHLPFTFFCHSFTHSIVPSIPPSFPSQLLARSPLHRLLPRISRPLLRHAFFFLQSTQPWLLFLVTLPPSFFLYHFLRPSPPLASPLLSSVSPFIPLSCPGSPVLLFVTPSAVFLYDFLFPCLLRLTLPSTVILLLLSLLVLLFFVLLQ